MKTSTINYRGALVMALLLALPAIAGAHAFVDRAEPKVGSEGPAPTELKIWFTQQPEVKFSKMEVFDAGGKRVDKNDLHADADDRRELIVSLETLPPGTYKVRWKVLSVDTHRTSGDFKFTVR